MQAISFDQWKSDIAQGIESSAHFTEKDDRFVRVILCDRYQFSEDDAVNATDAKMLVSMQVDFLSIRQFNRTFMQTPKAKLTVGGDTPQLWDVE